MQVKHVSRISFSPRRSLQDERNLPVGHGVFGKIVVNDQCIHAIVHEPLAHRRPGKGGKVLVRSRIGSGRSKNDGVRHCSRIFECGNDPGNAGLLLADRDVDAIQRTIVFVAGFLCRLVEAGLADDGVDTDGRLTSRAIADDQLALAAPDRNHGIDSHDARLYRLAYWITLDNSRSKFFDRIRDIGFDWSFAIDWLAEHVHDSSQQTFADGDLQQLARCPNFVPFFKLCVIAKNDDANFGFIQVQRNPSDAVAEIEHFVDHRVRKAFNSCDTVTDLADDPYVLLGRDCRSRRNFSFNLPQYVGHTPSLYFRYTKITSRKPIPLLYASLIAWQCAFPVKTVDSVCFRRTRHFRL